MPQIKLQEIQKELVRLSIHYPEAMMDAESLYSIAEDYYESFSHWDTKRFKAALKWVRENCKFWPKIVDFQEADERYDSELEKWRRENRWRNLPNGKTCKDCEFFDRCETSHKSIICTQGTNYNLFSEKVYNLVEERNGES
jgi:hypothetical protein